MIGYGLDWMIINFSNKIEIVLFYLFVAIGSVLPDIDTPKSFLGSKFKILSSFLFDIFGHRTITHSVLFWTIIFFIFGFLADFNVALLGLIIGVFAHIFGDMIDGKVPVAYPLCKKGIGLGVVYNKK